MDESRRDRGANRTVEGWWTTDASQELLAQICPPIGEIGLARPAFRGSPLVRNQLEGMTKSIALLEYVGNRVRRSLAHVCHGNGGHRC
jgi:hypothetical protein